MRQALASRSSNVRERWPGLALAVTLAVFFLLLWTGIGFRDNPSDLILYFDYANYVDDGNIPYRDFQFEYPPLALAPILIAFYASDPLGGFFTGFTFAFAVVTYLLALGCGLLAWSIMRRILPDTTLRERYWRMATFVAAFPLLGQIVVARLDLAPTLLTVGAIALWLRRTRNAEYGAWLVLAAGVATKLSPIVIAPIFAIDTWRRRSMRSALLGGMWFLLSVALLFAPGIVVSPKGFLKAFTYHSDRGIQIESVYAMALLWFSRLTDSNIIVVNAFGAFEVVSTSTNWLRSVTAVAQIVVLGSVYLAFLRATWTMPPSRQRDRLVVLSSLLAITAFIAFGKVFSPQYLIWIIPLVVVTPGTTGRWAIVIMLLTLGWTQLLYPYGYEALLDDVTAGLVVLTYRNVLFLALFAILVLAYARQARGSARVS